MNNVNVKRPAAGTILGVLGIIVLVLFGLMLLLVLFALFFGGAMFQAMLQNSAGVDSAVVSSLQTMSSYIIALVVFLIAVFVFEVFVVVGIFKGQMWTIIFTIILHNFI